MTYVLHVCVCACICEHACKCVCVCLNVRVRVCVCVCVCAYEYADVWMHASRDQCMHVDMCMKSGCEVNVCKDVYNTSHIGCIYTHSNIDM